MDTLLQILGVAPTHPFRKFNLFFLSVTVGALALFIIWRAMGVEEATLTLLGILAAAFGFVLLAVLIYGWGYARDVNAIRTGSYLAKLTYNPRQWEQFASEEARRQVQSAYGTLGLGVLGVPVAFIWGAITGHPLVMSLTAAWITTAMVAIVAGSIYLLSKSITSDVTEENRTIYVTRLGVLKPWGYMPINGFNLRLLDATVDMSCDPPAVVLTSAFVGRYGIPWFRKVYIPIPQGRNESVDKLLPIVDKMLLSSSKPGRTSPAGYSRSQAAYTGQQSQLQNRSVAPRPDRPDASAMKTEIVSSSAMSGHVAPETRRVRSIRARPESVSRADFDLLKAAIANLKSARTLHVNLELSGNEEGVKAEGDIDTLSSNLKLSLVYTDGTSLNVVRVGNNSYVSSDNGTTYRQTDSSVISNFDPHLDPWSRIDLAGLDKAKDAFKYAKPPTETIDGVETRHITGSLEELRLIYDLDNSEGGTLDLWVTTGDKPIVRQMIVSGDSNLNSTVGWSNINAPISITPPATGMPRLNQTPYSSMNARRVGSEALATRLASTSHRAGKSSYYKPVARRVRRVVFSPEAGGESYYPMPVARPWVVTAIVTLNIISIFVLIIYWFVFLSASLDAQTYSIDRNLAADIMLPVTAVMLVVATLEVVLSVGLWRLRNWARISTIVLYGFGIAGGLCDLLYAQHSDFGVSFSYYAGTLFSVAVLVGLCSRRVATAFR